MRDGIRFIAPWHRVIGASGDLTGFAGGPVTKETLLAVEGHGQAGGGQLLLF